MTSPDPYIAETRAWVRRAVIGLNLCPFANAPESGGRVRYVVSAADSIDGLIVALSAELALLATVAETQTETTLVIHPFVLTDFIAFNDFLGPAEGLIDRAGLEGFVQLASFHPHYRFAGKAADDIGNATNRSPYPTLQLLRESSVDRAVRAVPDPETIFANNIATMERLGTDGWAALKEACRRDAS